VSARAAVGSYRVAFTYREPAVEVRRAWGPRPYRAVFVVRASGQGAAIARAREAFDRLAVQSAVSWERRIVELEVRELELLTLERLDGAAE
jgi:hypothetical protein